MEPTNSKSVISDRTMNEENVETLKRKQFGIRSKRLSYEKFEDACGFKFVELSSFENFVRLLYRPTDPANLGIARALFGKFS